MKLGVTVTYGILEGLLMWECLYIVCTFFGGRAGSDINTGHIFLQRVLAAITLMGGGAGDGGARAGVRCEAGLAIFSVAYQGWGQVPSCWSRSPEGQV